MFIISIEGRLVKVIMVVMALLLVHVMLSYSVALTVFTIVLRITNPPLIHTDFFFFLKLFESFILDFEESILFSHLLLEKLRIALVLG
jgi:hypothetical protein